MKFNLRRENEWLFSFLAFWLFCFVIVRVDEREACMTVHGIISGKKARKLVQVVAQCLFQAWKVPSTNVQNFVILL